MQEECVDLVGRFGRQYRIGYEEQKRETPRAEWPWLARIRCRRGWIGVYGGDLLQAFTTRPQLGRRLRALPCVLASRGDVETVVRFHVDDIEAIFAILLPMRRPQLSAGEKARRREQVLRLPRREKAPFRGLESTRGDQDSPAGADGSSDAKSASKAVAEGKVG